MGVIIKGADAETVREESFSRRADILLLFFEVLITESVNFGVDFKC